MKKVISQFRERNVIQYTIIYSGAIWGFIQVANFLAEKFDFNVAYIKLLTIIGFCSIPSVIVFFFFRLQEKSLKRQLLFYIPNLTAIVIFLLWIRPFDSSEAKGTAIMQNHVPKPEAYDWFIKGKFRLNPENKGDVDSCILFFKKAIALDSTFSEAYAQLSIAYSIKNYFIDPKGGYSEKAFVNASRALLLNPLLAEGHFAKAYCMWTFENKFPSEEAIKEYRRVIILDPELDEAYHQLAIVYIHVGLYREAIKNMGKSLELNPNDNFARIDMPSITYLAGDSSNYQKSIDNYKQLPDKLITPFRASQWAVALIVTNQIEDAKKLLQNRFKNDSTDIWINSAYAILLAKEGDKNASLKIVEKLEKSNFSTGHFHHLTYNLAIAYSWNGEREKAMDKLTWTAEHGFPSWTLFKNDPLLKPLHGYPPFERLLGKLRVTYLKFEKISVGGKF